MNLGLVTSVAAVDGKAAEADFRRIISCSTAVQSWHLLALQKERFAFQLSKKFNGE